jgi:hypothetical protein
VLRIERERSRLTLVSRLARPRVLAVLAGVLALAALAAGRSVPLLAAAFAAAAALVALLGGRAVRARFERDRVRVRPAVPFAGEADRALAEFSAARVETLAEARRRRAERRSEEWRRRSGAPPPDWLRAPDSPGRNDHLRRIVLVGPPGEPLAVTAWLAEDELEGARVEIEAMLGR